MRAIFLGGLVALAGASPAIAEPAGTVRYFEHVCGSLPFFNDACGMAQSAAEMLSPTYEKDKQGRALERLTKLGYAAEYVPARQGMFGDTTDVFLLAKPASNRLYVFITGTESKRDWYENAKAVPYTTRWRDGLYYTPPGHAGFRSGALNVIGALLKPNEYDQTGLHCDGRVAPRGASRLTAFICASGVRTAPQARIEVVVGGHSRGAGIATLIAPALAGFEIRTPDNGRSASVERQAEWPLDFGGLVGFAPPYAIYTRTDEQAGVQLPEGAPNQWQVYQRAGIIDRALMFYNDRDIVPLLSLGLGRQIGHKFRITPERRLEYVGFGSLNTVSLIEAHGSGGYCHDILGAFARSDEDALCDRRTYSEPAIGERLGEQDQAPSR